MFKHNYYTPIFIMLTLASTINIASSEICETPNDCSDGLFCTGIETCSPSDSRADARGCVMGTPPNCNDGLACTVDSCNEIYNSCESLAPDRDGDGSGDATCVNDLGEPLGRDCDDNNPLRFGGNLEVCDAHDLDEDCDSTTFGTKDDDNDGFIDADCGNWESYR
ncbi:MAG: hypothetical protein AB8B92_01880 [Gammaproteobacteria bacterium]